MKKRSFVCLAIVAIAAALSSCGNSKPKDVTLKTELDSLSYSFGALNTQGLNGYLSGRLQLDSLTALDPFLKGFNEALRDTSAETRAYRAGVQLGEQVAKQFGSFEGYFFANDSTKKINRDAFIAAFYAAAKGNDLKISLEDAGKYIDALEAKKLEAEYGDNKAAGIAFLAENAKKEGVVTLPSGLQYKIIKEGKGATPAENTNVKVNYRGTFIDGTEFDSSFKRNEPYTANTSGGVIAGWQEALKLMPVGSKWEIYVPQELGYGANAYGGIKPFSTLIFEIELLEIVK